LHDLVHHMVTDVPSIHCLRDPTRGGIATTLNEWAQQSGVGFMIDERQIPIRSQVNGACELLGLDAMYVANEGKLLAIVPAVDSSRLLTTMRAHPLGKDAAIIGEVIDDPRCFVQLKTKMGGIRMMDWLTGEQLPRIC
jgi:hydrogenase expression/formation protein HypE